LKLAKTAFWQNNSLRKMCALGLAGTQIGKWVALLDVVRRRAVAA